MAATRSSRAWRSMGSAASAWTRPWPSSRKSAPASPTCCDRPAKAATGPPSHLRVHAMTATASAGARFRAALAAESPLQVVGAINANHALLARRAGYRAIYLSGGGVAAGSLGIPDLGITGLEDVLVDVRRITDVCELPLLVDIDTGFGPSAFNIERTVKSLIKAGAAACHIEDQVGAK